MTDLDAEHILQRTFVARVEHHATLRSTNDRAKELSAAREGPLPLLVVADEQTAGRGRGRHRWWTGRGSLAFSLLLDPEDLGVDRSGSPLVGLAAAVAIAETVAPLLADGVVGVRWPNDVFAQGRKLAGTLVEVVSRQGLVLGIGLNVNDSLCDAPPELREAASTLLELTGRPHQKTQILVRLLEQLEGTLGQLAAAPTQVAARADALCLQHGDLLTIRCGERSTSGRCLGIAPDGALVLDTPRGRSRFYSGVLS
ncbi:MAG: biotin--[acetyl-CoA-carboxylase] ligase [Planctomycetota bacterium]|jgi:BirA family biotin operon repressor/biotin-[acetyl-CoA-carboxylase] ligase